MTARYKGQIVRVVRIESHRAYIVWQGMIKRVNKTDLDDVIDSTLIASLVAALLACAWLVLR